MFTGRFFGDMDMNVMKWNLDTVGILDVSLPDEIGLKKEIVCCIIENGTATLLMKMLLLIAVNEVGYFNDNMPYLALGIQWYTVLLC
jgi:hypothetical protein